MCTNGRIANRWLICIVQYFIDHHLFFCVTVLNLANHFSVQSVLCGYSILATLIICPLPTIFNFTFLSVSYGTFCETKLDLPIMKNTDTERHLLSITSFPTCVCVCVSIDHEFTCVLVVCCYGLVWPQWCWATTTNERLLVQLRTKCNKQTMKWLTGWQITDG